MVTLLLSVYKIIFIHGQLLHLFSILNVLLFNSAEALVTSFMMLFVKFS